MVPERNAMSFIPSGYCCVVPRGGSLLMHLMNRNNFMHLNARKCTLDKFEIHGLLQQLVVFASLTPEGTPQYTCQKQPAIRTMQRWAMCREKLSTFNFIGNYRQPNESPSPIERSPLYGNTTPVEQMSPYNAGRTSVTPTPGGYQPNVMNPDFLLGGTQQFQNQYAFPTLPPTNGQPQMYLHQPQQQFQPPANMNNQQQFNVSNLIDPQDQLPQPGPSGVQAVPSFQLSGSIGEINISSPWLTKDSSELKSLMVHTLSDMKQRDTHFSYIFY